MPYYAVIFGKKIYCEIEWLPLNDGRTTAIETCGFGNSFLNPTIDLDFTVKVRTGVIRIPFRHRTVSFFTDIYFSVFSSRPVGNAWHVRQVFANGNQTDPARHVAHTKELSQGVREDAQTVPERNLSTWRL